MNQCHFMGFLTRDPELKAVAQDKHVVNFGIAVNNRYKKGDEVVTETTFLDCEAWNGKAATIDKWFKKGSPIIIHGSLKQDEWEDKDTGKKRVKHKLRVIDFEFLPKNEGTEKVPDGEAKAPAPKKAPYQKGRARNDG